MKGGLIYTTRRKLQIAALKATSPEFMSKTYFKIVLGYKLNLKNPKTFNEKLQWLKLYQWSNDSKAIQCADKYLVRSYIEAIGKKEILNDLICAWDDADQIEWDILPNKFVLKCNHGCGYNIICPDKSKLDKDKTIKKLKKWMAEDFSKFNVEPHYGKIKRKIICEKFLEGDVVNYNIYIFNGKAVFLSVAGGLGDGVDEHLTYYNPDGSVAPFRNRDYPMQKDVLSPLLPKMIDTAEYLAKGFPMVRVDLFDVNGSIILSEMTFTPGGALIPFDPVKFDLELGKKLDISELIRKRDMK